LQGCHVQGDFEKTKGDWLPKGEGRTAELGAVDLHKDFNSLGEAIQRWNSLMGKMSDDYGGF